MATGSPDLFLTYQSRLHNRTQVGLVDSTGLVNTSTGRHLIGWDPAPTKAMFTSNSHMSVTNAWAIFGLDALTDMATAAGNKTAAALYATETENLRSAMIALMWDPRVGHFCDGPCKDRKVVAGNSSGFTTDFFTLALGLIPTSAVRRVWEAVAVAGLESVGDYGSHVYMNALAAYHGDDGTAVLNALTKRDNASWWAELAVFNATMTTESLGKPHATMSHPWGTAPISGVAKGVFGVQQTAPGWASFTVKPQLATLRWANLTIPTIRGPIIIAATSTRLTVDVPCNSVARLCLPTAVEVQSTAEDVVLLDGLEVKVVVEGNTRCIDRPVGCKYDAYVLTTTSAA